MVEHSVVLVVGDRSTTVEEQLTALAAETAASSVPVVVVDRGRRGRTIPDAGREVRLVRAPGASAPQARNAGAGALESRAVLYCDGSSVVRPGWLAALVTGLDEAPIVGGWGVPVGGAGQGSVAVRDRLPVFNGWCPYVYADCCAMRREALDALGGWRARYGRGQDGVDLAFRARGLGLDLAFAPAAVVERSEPGPGAFLRDRIAMGLMDAALYRDHRRAGMPGRRPADVVRTWGWCLRHAPDAAAAPPVRRRWLQAAGESVGRAAGSVRYGVVYL